MRHAPTPAAALAASLLSVALFAISCSPPDNHGGTVTSVPAVLPAAEGARPAGDAVQTRPLRTRPIIVECVEDGQGNRVATFLTGGQDTLRVRRGQRITFVSLNVSGTFRSVPDDPTTGLPAWLADPHVDPFRSDDTAYAERVVTGRVQKFYTLRFESSDPTCGSTFGDAERSGSPFPVRRASAYRAGAPLTSSPRMLVQ